MVLQHGDSESLKNVGKTVAILVALMAVLIAVSNVLA